MMTKLSKYWLAIDKSKQTTIITLTVLHFFLLPICTSVVAASFQLCTMRDTNPSLLDSVGTPLVAASFLCHLSTMRDTNSSLHNLVGTSLVAASFLRHLSSMCDADSSCIGSIGAPVEAASCPRCAMRDTNASFNNTIVTSLVATSFPHCAMSHTNSSLHGSLILDTSLLAAFLSSPYARLDTRLRFSDDRLFLRPLHLWDNCVIYFMITAASGITGHGNGNDN